MYDDRMLADMERERLARREDHEQAIRMFASPGTSVRAFDPRTLGVVKVGTVVKVGRTYVHVDFGLSGTARVAFRDVLSTV